jgi:hypothetical protein
MSYNRNHGFIAHLPGFGPDLRMVMYDNDGLINATETGKVTGKVVYYG